MALESINSRINSLKYREEFSKSLSKILDEFEMLNSSLEFVDKKTRTQRNLRSILDEETKEELVPSEPTSQGFMVPEEDSVIPTITDEEIKPEEVKSEKLRVVEIIPISDTVTEKEEEKDFMVNDFQDDDYVDFESAISTVEDN